MYPESSVSDWAALGGMLATVDLGFERVHNGSIIVVVVHDEIWS